MNVNKYNYIKFSARQEPGSPANPCTARLLAGTGHKELNIRHGFRCQVLLVRLA